MRPAWLAFFVACSSSASGSIASPGGVTTQASVVIVDPVSVPSASGSVSSPIAASPSASVSEVAPQPPSPKVVLHLGDSMVGGYGGLTKALEGKFKGLGAHFVADWEVSVSISTFDHRQHLQELLTKHAPDLVILTLGANDVFVPFPSSLASNVQSIARKMSAGGRTCFWMAPPVWKKDTGIVAVIKKNASPCKVFDASYMRIGRAGDGIHPTDRGGADWADAFYAFYRGTGPGTPNEPQQGQGISTE
jgi:lysophospholipase L1-like esterase